MHLHYPRCLEREHPLKWYFLCTTMVYLIICTMVKLRLYRIQIIWFKYSIHYPCTRSMIHSGLQFAQCWTSFNLNWIKSRLTKIALSDCQWCVDHQLLWIFSRCGQIHWTCSENTRILGKSWEDSHHPKSFPAIPPSKKVPWVQLSYNSTWQTCEEQGKTKCVRNHQICLLYFTSWIVGLCHACHLILAVSCDDVGFPG